MVASASTNVHNMTTDPVRVLLVSAFWVQSTLWIWPMAALIVAVMAPAERLLGTGHTLFIFAAGHIGATVLTVAAVGVGVDRGLFPHHLAYAADVGPSYGLVSRVVSDFTVCSWDNRVCLLLPRWSCVLVTSRS